MYGMINKAMRTMVLSTHGEETWVAICKQASIEETVFVSLKSYPDSLTYDLVAAASAVLDVDANELLRSFGHYWIEFAKDAYGAFFAMGGATLYEFLQHLDQMHARLGTSFPEMKPPSFRCEVLDSGDAVLRYTSTRQGLAPFVIGLVEGLAAHFSEDVAVTLKSSSNQTHEFRITHA